VRTGLRRQEGSLHRIAPVLAAELGDQGIRAYNLDPRVVATKLNLIAMADHGIDSSVGASPDVIGEVVIDLLRRLDVGESGGAPLPRNWAPSTPSRTRARARARADVSRSPGTLPRRSDGSARSRTSAQVSSQWKTRAADA
jgi:hypothetical protein